MAKPAAQTKKRPTKKPAPSLPQKAQSRQKLFWIAAAYLVVLGAGNYFFFRTKVEKQFPVRETFRFSGAEKKSGDFNSADITAVGKDKFAITDNKTRRIVVFNKNGDFLKSIGKAGKGTQDFNSAVGITTDDKNNIYAIDWIGSIHVVDPNLNLEPSISLAKVGTYGPRGIAWDDNNLLVADTGDHRIIKVSMTGDLVAKWGQQGDCDECFKNPSGIAVDHKGNIYVADFDNNRVVWTNSDGKVKKIINIGARPSDVAVGPDGTIFISSAEGGFVKAYNADGKLIGPLKEQQNSDSFSDVQGLGMMDDGTLLLAEGDYVAGCVPAPPAPKK